MPNSEHCHHCNHCQQNVLNCIEQLKQDPEMQQKFLDALNQLALRTT